jgi:hypothetical protein
MASDNDSTDTPELPSLEKGPRQPADQEYTGTGTSRSDDDGRQEPGAVGDRYARADPAVVVGATTSSHPADADEIQINRSGSGGSGGAATDDENRDGSTPVSMEDLLAGDPEGGTDS